MIRRGMIAVLIFASVVTCSAEEFYLKMDKTGKVYGPFSTDAGSKVAIGKTTFTVVQKKKSGPSVEEKLSAIKIPAFNMRMASLEDAIKYLEKEVRARDPKKTGVKFVVKKAAASKNKVKKPIDPFDFEGGSDDFFDTGPRVTADLKDVPALDVLKILMQLTGSTYKISGNTVTIQPGQ